MRRVVVFGTTGSGKSRLAERLGERTGLRVVELDALNWGPGWQPAPLELLRHRVEREIRDGDWIVRSEERTSELQSHRDLHSFPTRRSSDLGRTRRAELGTRMAAGAARAAASSRRARDP